MGKIKDKKAKRSSDAVLEMSPYSSYVHESPQQLAFSTESSVLGSSRRLDMLTCSSEKSKKKQKKGDLAALESENMSSEFQTEGEQESPKKKRKSRDFKTPSNKPSELHLTDMVDSLAAETSHHEEPERKKKKKVKLRQTEETVAHDVSDIDVSRKKEKKKRSIDKVEEMNGTPMSDENEIMNDERTGNSVKKKKNGKKKEKENHIQIFESAPSSAQSVQESGFNESTETGEKQAEKIKKKKDKVKKNLIEILGSEQLVKENGSTDPQKMDEVNESTEPEKSTAKKRKKNEATHKRGLKTRKTQTIQKSIKTKSEKTDEGFQVNVHQRLLEELKQFLPNVESRVPADINKLIHYDLPRYKEFKRMGIPLNHGRFTVTENETLKKNVEDFLALTGIDSGTKLFYTQRFAEEKFEIMKLKRDHRFFESIARDIPRSCHDVYTRGRKLFEVSTCNGIFTESELHQLRKLQTLHGNNWKKISELTGRSALSLEKRFSHFTKRVGVWSKKELQRLLRAVREYIISEVQPTPSNIDSLWVSREMLYKGLPWQNISKKVKTRSWNKCREKWLSFLAGVVHRENANEAKIKLIKVMYQMQIEDVADVNWDELSALFGDVPPFYVQKKWNRLKICYVPNWQSKCFAEIIDFLYEKVLPLFEEQFKGQVDHDDTQLMDSSSQAKSFLLSDIFQYVNDQDANDEEEEEKEEEEEVVVNNSEEV